MGDNARFAFAGLPHLSQLALTDASNFLDYSSGIFVIDVDCDFFNWLKTLAVFPFAHQHLRS